MIERLNDSDLRSRAMSGVRWSGASVAYSTVAQFVTTAILAHLISPSDFGLMGMVLVVIGFAGVVSEMGVSGGIIAYENTTREQLSTLCWLNVIIGLFLFVLIFAAKPLAVAFFKEPRISIYLPWIASTFVISPLGVQFGILLQKELRFRAFSRIEVACVTLSSVSAIVIALLGYGIWSLVCRSIVLTTSTTIMYVGMAVKHKWLPSLRLRIREVKHHLQFGAFQIGSRFLSYFYSNLDYMIIGRFLGVDALGFYTLAWNLMNFPTSKINPVITRVAFPTFARIQHDDQRLRSGYLRLIKYVSAYSFPLMAGLFVVAPFFIPVVYGAKWKEAVPVLQVLCLVGALRSIANPFGSLLLAKGRADLQFYWMVFASIVLVFACLISVKWGIVGVAYGVLVISYVILWPVDFYIRWHLIRMKVKDYISSLKVPAAASGIMMALVWFVGLVSNQMNSILSLILQIVFGATIYFLITWMVARPLCLEVKEALFSRG